MGNFEKLSVVVIVVIIVMILVVAITEWTGSPATETATSVAQGPIDPQPSPLPMPEPTPAPRSDAPVDRKDPASPKDKGGLARIDRKNDKDAKPVDPLDWQNDPKKLIPEETPSVDGEGVKPVDGEKPIEPATPSATEVAETTHVVVSGDTLGGISKKYYGKASLYSRIVEANPGVGERDLRVGVKLKIPAMKVEATKLLATTTGGGKGAPERASAGSDAGGDGPVPGKPYKVKATDTWERISKAAYKTSDRWPDIYMSNLKITASPKDLRANLVIMIPQ